MHPFAEAGKDDGLGLVPLISETARDGLPSPASEPSAPDQNVCGHPKDLLRERSRGIVF